MPFFIIMYAQINSEQKSPETLPAFSFFMLFMVAILEKLVHRIVLSGRSYIFYVLNFPGTKSIIFCENNEK
ncbi:MAG: hypothetical protein D5R98_05840 [Desulfonatronovibrio sp. MSAO_Bac4]|nr:MAG: hypothetical protein D5R98_05840 [Desulfonatronovibrio sp. MSAO_Bac4]